MTAARPSRLRLHSVTLFSAVSLIAQSSQAQTSPEPASAEACAALSSDNERLACYDRLFRRIPDLAAQADSAAEQAKAEDHAGKLLAEQEQSTQPALAPVERAQQIVGNLFSLDNDDTRIANAGKGSLFDTRWELARDSKLGTFNFRAYKPVYLFPLAWSNHRDKLPTSSNPDVPAERQSLKSAEAAFQISFKTKAVENLIGDNGDVWLGYTQTSRWQVYSGKESRPFRESNYEPEALMVFRTNYGIGPWRGRLLGIGVNHQSNGRADPLSRSWNRVMVNIGLDREDWALMLRPWWRISDGNQDENPGIQNYIGRGDLTLVHRRKDHELALMARHSLRGGDNSRGAVQLDWGFPLTRTLRGHVQIFDGYGESLIDYDHRAWSVGLGLSLLEWY